MRVPRPECVGAKEAGGVYILNIKHSSGHVSELHILDRKTENSKQQKTTEIEKKEPVFEIQSDLAHL